MKSMLLIHPPVVRNCEAPIALLKLSAALKEAGASVRILDGAIESYKWLSDTASPVPDNKRFSSLLLKRERLWRGLCSRGSNTYHSLDRYKRNLNDLNTIATSSFKEKGIRLTAADLEIPGQSPLKKQDLIQAWDHPESSPYFPWFESRLKQMYSDEAFTHIGMSFGYLTQALTGMSMAGYIKRSWPHVKIQLGGGLITSWLQGPADCTFLTRRFDDVNKGPGEQAIVEFCSLDWKGAGQFQMTGLQELPYISPGLTLPYSASSGCSWKRCLFCNERWENNPFHEEPSHKTVTNLQRLCQELNPSLIHLTDSEISLSLMKAMIERPPGAPWYSFSRFFPELMNPDFCFRLKESGCKMLCLGLESGDQDVLNALKKGIQLQQVRIILKNLKEAGIGTYIYIMFGTSPENRQSALKTRDFIVENQEAINFLNAAVFSMPIGSKEIQDYDNRSFYEGDLALYKDFTHPRGWQRGEVRRFMSHDFQNSQDIRRILKRTPPVFTSSHAPFFV